MGRRPCRDEKIEREDQVAYPYRRDARGGIVERAFQRADIERVQFLGHRPFRLSEWLHSASHQPARQDGTAARESPVASLGRGPDWTKANSGRSYASGRGRKPFHFGNWHDPEALGCENQFRSLGGRRRE